jgi:HSP20 family protein
MTRDLLPWRRKREDAALARETANPIVELHRRMDDLFNDFFEGFALTRWPFGEKGERFALTPSVDVSETDDEITVTADLPGMDEKDIEVTLDNDVLVLRGEKKREHEEKKRNYHLVERAYGEFCRRIPLAADIEPEKVKARFSKGVLTVSIPKKPEARSREKRIQISSE